MAYDVKLEGKNMKIAERMLKNIVKICKHCNINSSLEAGTLLGIFRENRLLPWDNDLDLSVLSNESNKFENLIKTLKKSNYRVKVRYFLKDNAPFKKGDIRVIKIRESFFLGLIKGNICLEIFVLYPMDNKFYWKVGNKKACVPDKFFKSYSKINFQNQKYLIPNHTEDYLKYRYGDWNKQKKKWDSLNDDFSLE